jgi:hypothetical protein
MTLPTSPSIGLLSVSIQATGQFGPVPPQILLMGTGMVPELVLVKQRTWLMAQDLINISQCESFRSYAVIHVFFKISCSA